MHAETEPYFTPSYPNARFRSTIKPKTCARVRVLMPPTGRPTTTGDPPSSDLLCISGCHRARGGPHGLHRVEVHSSLVRPSFPGGFLSRRHVPAVRHHSRRDYDQVAAQGRLGHGGVLGGDHLRADAPNGPGGSDCYPSDGSAPTALV